MDSNVTLAENTTRSLATQPPSCPLPSTPDAAALSTVIAELSSESYSTILVLLCLLHGITENTTSGDVLALAAYRAQDLSRELGVDEDTFADVIRRYSQFAQAVRRWNPLAY